MKPRNEEIERVVKERSILNTEKLRRLNLTPAFSKIRTKLRKTVPEKKDSKLKVLHLSSRGKNLSGSLEENTLLKLTEIVIIFILSNFLRKQQGFQETISGKQNKISKKGST